MRVNNIVNILISNEKSWEAISNMVSIVHKKLLVEEERRKILRFSALEVN